jgi:hypothetical protein
MVLSREKSGQRIVETRQRVGGDMEPTQLGWDAERYRVEIGQTTAQYAEEMSQATELRIKKAMLMFVSENPDCTQNEVYRAVRGDTTLLRKTFASLTFFGDIAESGNGKKGSPFTYRAANALELREDAAQERSRPMAK